MRILIVGSGGREHALAWYLSQSKQVDKIYVAPGNAGTAAVGENVDIASDDVDGLLVFAREQGVDLTIVGPEKPLVLGIVDRFRAEDLPIVGPTAGAARLEGSKAFAKAFMKRHGIPTARHRTFSADRLNDALTYLEQAGAPIVVKASGLAAGKGAIVCATVEEGRGALRSILQDRTFGAAGEEVVIEEFMEGEEASVFVLTDGRDYVLLPPAQDHKAVGDGDSGPNTGGMGAYAPAPVVTDDVIERVRREIIEPTLRGMADEGAPYTGVLYCGLMITSDGPRVVEFNCRFGDPEAQVLLPLLDEDAADLFRALAHGDLSTISGLHRDASAVCVVLASGGYPGPYEKGFPIAGLDEAANVPGVMVFHAGTAHGAGGIVTAGGRVLGVTAVADDLPSALERAYEAVARISFEGMHYRRDIGRKALQAT